MNILEIGGAGFVGSHLGPELVKQAHNLSVVDNLVNGEYKNVPPQANFYHLDVRSPKLREIFEQERPEMMIYLAAQKSVPYSVENPVFDADVNILGLLNALQLSVEFGVEKVVFFSTGALYGNTQNIPTPETQDPELMSPYAISKYSGEKYLAYYHGLHDITHTIIRPANIYGPKQKRDGECGVIPIYIQNILANEPSVLYAYSDMPEGVTRDYIYVEDVVRAVMLILNENDSNTYNIGSGQEVYTKQIYELLREISHTDQPLILMSERVGDVKRNALDTAKAQALLGWFAQVNLQDGLEETYEYEKNKRK